MIYHFEVTQLIRLPNQLYLLTFAPFIAELIIDNSNGHCSYQINPKNALKDMKKKTFSRKMATGASLIKIK